MTDRDCLIQIVKHLGLWENPDPEFKHHEHYHECLEEIRIGCGGGDEGTRINFVFNPDGSVKEHYIFEGPSPTTK